MIRIPPGDALLPFVHSLWLAGAAAAPSVREHSLPGGAMHVAIRLDAPLRLHAGADDRDGYAVARAVVAGARARYCIKDTSLPTRSVGAVLRPGAAQALFGCSALELADRHVPLEQLWGADAGRLLERLQAEVDPQRQLQGFAAALRARLRPAGGLHPPVAVALQALVRGRPVAEAAIASGHSHRHFIARVSEAVGLTPKRYARVRRFRHALRHLAGTESLAAVAQAAGYSDQAHFQREFRELAGVTPRTFRAARPLHPRHLPVDLPR